MSWIGKSVKRREDATLVRGYGEFVADLVADAVFVRFVRSTVAHGRISAVQIPEGVTAFTVHDMADVAPIRPLLYRPDYIPTDQPILARERVRFVGEPIVAVVAPTPEASEDEAERIRVDIEPDDVVADVDSALESGSVRVHENAPENTLVEGNLRTQDFDEVLASGATILEMDVRSYRQSAVPLEARGARADYNHRTGRVTLFATTQLPHMLRTGVADILGIEEALLRVVTPDIGGAFGQKLQLAAEYVVVVWLARKLQCSVAWVEDRPENFMASFHSRDQHYLIKAAFDSDARLLALEADLRCNVGAYSSYPWTCGTEPLMAMAELPGPYDIQAYGVRARGVTTHTCPVAPYRGVSRPVLTLAMESLMDAAARQFNLEPVEVRKRNLVTSFPYASVTGAVYDKGSYSETLDVAVESIGLESFRTRQIEERARGRYLGIGFSVYNERTGYGTPAFAVRSMQITPGYETVEIAMDPSGGVEARIGAAPHGQGLHTSLSQIIADELGINPARVNIVHGDTDRTPYGWGTFASRSIVISGGAAKLAAVKLAEQIATLAGHRLQVEAKDIVLDSGRASVRGQEASIEINELARLAYYQSHQFDGDSYASLSVRATYDPGGTYSNGCHATIVEVDVETGEVNLERFVAVEDAGKLINPVIAEGQIRGGIAQGIANALYEKIIYDHEGNILTTSLMDYLVPSATEVPDIEIIHLETITEESVTGAKGLGEGGTIGAPAAIINAVSDALSPFGVEIAEIPITPERIRTLIGARTEVSG